MSAFFHNPLHRRRAVLIGGSLAGLLIVIFLSGAGVYYYLAPGLPDVATLRDVRLQVPLRIYTRDGRLLAQIGEQRRTPVRFEDIPTPVLNAFIAAEDDRFYSHGGIDSFGLLRAALASALTGEVRQGGSTITMQLARNMFLTPEKNLRRKLREIFLSLRMEREFSKQEILTLYLNKIFLGQRAYGVGAAAEVYYGKPLRELSLGQIATIAALPKAPSTLNPVTNPERAQQRRSYVLRRMLDKGFITKAEHDAANAEPIDTYEHALRVEVDAPYVAEMVRAQLVERYGDDLYTGGYRIYTSIDSRLQRTADWSVRAALLEYDRRHGWRGVNGHTDHPPTTPGEAMQMLDAFPVVGGLIPSVVTATEGRSAKVYGRDGRQYVLPWNTGLAWARQNGAAPKESADILKTGDVVYVLPARDGNALLAQVPQAQGAFVALDPHDGAITALVGGFDYYASKFNRVVQARRQPGSSFKPFIYSSALEQGFTPATMVLDAPIVIEGSGLEGLWRPENDSRHFYGPTRLRDALARSRNLVSIRILRTLGVDYAIDYAQRFGFEPAELPHNLTVALGTAQLTPLEMVRGYAVFANGGFRVTPYLIDRVEDAFGKVLMTAHPAVACRDCDTVVEPPLPLPPGATPSDAVATEDVPLRSETVSQSQALSLAPRVISPANAFLMTDLMRDVIRKGTARRALSLKRDDIAGKTGTTNDRRDTWFSGFNADIVATAWVGFDQERSLGPNEEGGHTALPIWVYFMGEALAGRPEHRLPQPEGIVTARISPNTGALAKPNDPDAVFEFFLTGRLPGAGGLAGDGAGATTGKVGTSSTEESIF